MYTHTDHTAHGFRARLGLRLLVGWGLGGRYAGRLLVVYKVRVYGYDYTPRPLGVRFFFLFPAAVYMCALDTRRALPLPW